ncbi:Cationic amino acid transporter 2 [Chionoecetes opilio]|uniref:Cationic amino acid transporter 2 n=1 Tax=Chionoecetes opilio TaxID=41210 RepID=A0A8J4XP22_CHIOP|nr:Cationic amino acid transporter 2 [Chionoecetes opilio]
MAMLFNLDALVNMMSIGTLMAYTIVALCVLLLRYTVNEEDEDVEEVMSHSTPSTYYFQDYMRQLFNTKGLKKPTPLTASLVTYAVLCFCVVVLILDVLLVVLSEQLSAGAAGTIAALVVVIALNILILTVIARQPVSKKNLSFKVPLVPWIPALSTFINLYLMCNLHVDTWIRFAVWMAIGFINYFAYGLWNSALRTSDNKQGLDNLAFTDDRLKNHQLIIPKIEIQPATPLSSEPNTPVVKPRHTTPPPKSPLATGETQSSASDSWDTKTRPNEHDKTPLDAMAVVASLMKRKAMNKGLEANGQDVLGNGKEGTEGEGKDVVGNDKASLLMMRKSINKETGEPNEKGFDGRKGETIEGKDLGNDMRGSEGSVEGKVLENVDVSDGGVFSTSIVSPALPSDSPFDVRKAEADTQMAGLMVYFGYGINNSNIEYRMRGKKPPGAHPAESIGTIFDSDSEEEILYST